MKKIGNILLLLLALNSKVWSQTGAQGTINFDIVTVDTIKNVSSNLPDSIKYIYNYKGQNFSFQFGTDLVNQRLIHNASGTYIVDNGIADKKYSFEPNRVNLDSLSNYTDTTAMRFEITNDHKSVFGYYCTKAYLTFLTDLGNIQQTIIIWYTDQLQGNNFIPGASTSALNLNGLILEYESPTINGKTIVTPKSINLNTPDDSIFYPDLSGYVLDDGSN